MDTSNLTLKKMLILEYLTIIELFYSDIQRINVGRYFDKIPN